jgi:putative Mg2+ transporter-C (MgtC) family protein
MFSQTLQQYWQGDILAANAFIGLNLLGALLLGMLVGYERSFQGRAAGMRTYGLVCMASTALTILVGFAPLWYGGSNLSVAADPTRVFQGIVTGVGFLCAGVIMKDGLSIRGLTTAASIWAVSAIGILLGTGFYPSALLLAVLCAACMSFLQRIELRLPGRASLDVTVKFREGFRPVLEEVAERTQGRGYLVLKESVTVSCSDNQIVWRFGVVALQRSRAVSPTHVADELSKDANIASFSITPVRH